MLNFSCFFQKIKQKEKILKKQFPGFTLVEILTVAGIVIILAALAFPVFNSFLMSARDNERKAELNKLKVGLQVYYTYNDVYPTTSDWVSISDDPNFAQILNKTYLDSIPTDPFYPRVDDIGEKYSYYYKATTSDSYILCAKAEVNGGYLCVSRVYKGVEKLATVTGLGPVLPEDFTTYTKVDPNGKLSVTSSLIAFAGLTRNEPEAYVYKDMGENYFSGDFEHLFEFKITESTSGMFWLWGVGNYSVNFSEARGQGLRFWDTGDKLVSIVDKTTWANVFYASLNTTYYVKMKRIESETPHRLWCYVYSDPDRTILVASNNLQYNDALSCRYIYGLNSINSLSSGCSASGYVGNLFLQ